MTEAEYVKDRNGFGPTSDSKGEMPPGNVQNGGNVNIAKLAPNQD